ncbi:hypothetical protein ONA91_33285 [Micromonospora sp. DR5-3]|uniref:hypothetical protein n=1 Tax=unclassified Micromonospora TaxID=2617518 RepID=UPI002106D251|nr:MULTISPECIES: hypothetical protein [unclassified Micromonospora]MCW3819327.1 hypothetical protein [Micromonospora sp. DR5-3]
MSKVEPAGGDKAVTLAPVQLTDVVRDGHFPIDQALDLESQTFSPLPDLLGEVVDGTPATPVMPDAGKATGLGVNAIGTSGLRLAAPPIVLAPLAAPPIVLAPARGPGSEAARSVQRKVGDWEVTALQGQLEAGADRRARHGRRASQGRLRHPAAGPQPAGVGRHPGDQRCRSAPVVPHRRGRGTRHHGRRRRGGRVERQQEGEDRVSHRDQAAHHHRWLSRDPQADVQVPCRDGVHGEERQPAGHRPVGPRRPDRYVGSSVLTPAFSVQKSIMQSLRGVSIGVEAIVVAAEFRFGFMIGLPVAGAGPFVGVVASLGLTNGSAAGRVGLPLAGPAVKCRGSTLVLTVRAGEGINMSEPLAKAIE